MGIEHEFGRDEIVPSGRRAGDTFTWSSAEQRNPKGPADTTTLQSAVARQVGSLFAYLEEDDHDAEWQGK